MLIREYTVQTKATPEKLWKLYDDASNWTRWDDGLEWVTMEGGMKCGTKGQLKPVGGPVVNFVVEEAIYPSYFKDVSFLPLTRLTFEHTFERKGDVTDVTIRVEMKGLLAFFFAIVIGRDIKSGLHLQMEKLATIAEQSE